MSEQPIPSQLRTRVEAALDDWEFEPPTAEALIAALRAHGLALVAVELDQVTEAETTGRPDRRTGGVLHENGQRSAPEDGGPAPESRPGALPRVRDTAALRPRYLRRDARETGAAMRPSASGWIRPGPPTSASPASGE